MGTFGQRLKKLRNDYGISQNELSKHIGVSKSSVNMYERDEREPGFETLEAIADFFNVNMDYLLGRGPKVNTNIDPKNVDISVHIDAEQFSDTSLQTVIKLVSTFKNRKAPEFKENLSQIFEEMNQTFTNNEREYFLNVVKAIVAALDYIEADIAKNSVHTDETQASSVPQEGNSTPGSDPPDRG